jgi:hypothetical protein
VVVIGPTIGVRTDTGTGVTSATITDLGHGGAMRIQQDTTLSMNLQVEIAIPNEARHDDGAQAQVVVWPAGGDGDQAGLTHRWSFTPAEAEQLARSLQEAADSARAMT